MPLAAAGPAARNRPLLPARGHRGAARGAERPLRADSLDGHAPAPHLRAGVGHAEGDVPARDDGPDAVRADRPAGACERIKNTPLPRQYDILLLAITRAYLVLLPLGVVADLGWLTPFVTAVIAFLFIGLDAVGRDIETPFEDDVSDTPMTALCRTIEINLRQMLGETKLPAPVQPQNGLLY
nr:bestrophin family ion channel [Myxococcus hansupus]